ncbi:MAG TPA: multicopper oxidase domain-containing protein, partial [Fusibacter sp.]|nr:multicopper oxidase domain-containing protein [Fusibacter sp.]
MRLKLGLILIVITLIILGGIYMYMNNQSFEMPIQSPPQKQSEESDKNLLPIPELLADANPEELVADYYLNAQYGLSDIIGGKQTPTMGYNGNYLGPVIKVSNGEDVRMHVTNELDMATSVHWHGLVVPGAVDGGPH